ncbi:MAG: ABC transporter substrate-binding protein [Solobacterium sp.]|jgi:branched-chain amino acid transport system substrate-binding protein|nr:ABC transporter substrate-binding protein [Solobacterium sp.]
MNTKTFMKGGMAALMAMSLVACSSSTASSTASTSGSSIGGTIKIGVSGPLTGDAAVYGKAVANAASLAVEEINAQGGQQYEFKAEDDQADSEKAVTAYNNLVDWGMQLSLGTVTSGAGQAVSPLYKEDGIFALTPSASSTGVIYKDMADSSTAYGNVFQMCFTDPNQGSASAVYLSKHTNLGTKVGVIYRSDDNYSTGINTKFTAEAKELGLNVVASATFQNGATDFSVQVKQLADAGADVIFMPIYYQPATLILQEAKKQGVKATFFGCDGMDGILSQDGFDATLAEGLYMLTPFSADATDEKTVAFVKAYKAKYNETPNQFAADAYDAVYAIAQGAKAADITASSKAKDMSAAMIKQFTSMTFNGVTGTNVTWKATGEVSKDPRAIVIKSGAYVSAE